jgi:hypothetical protein
LLPKVVAITTVDQRNLGMTELAYKMIAERDNTTVRVERQSSLLIVAKAKIWASEGWQVVITDAEGNTYGPAEFEQIVAA